MKTVTAKFGGSSLADAVQFRKVAAIVREDPARRYIVATAPGKRSKDDVKVTDLLYACHDQAAAGQDPLSGGKSLSDSEQRRREQKEAEARRRRQENALKKTEEQIEALEERIAALEEQMALPENATDPKKLLELGAFCDAARKELDGLYQKWEELS